MPVTREIAGLHYHRETWSKNLGHTVSVLFARASHGQVKARAALMSQWRSCSEYLSYSMHLHLASIASWGRAGLFFHQRSFASTCKIWVVQALKLFFSAQAAQIENPGIFLPFALVPEKVWRRAPRATCFRPVGLAPLPSSNSRSESGITEWRYAARGSVGYVHPRAFFGGIQHIM